MRLSRYDYQDLLNIVKGEVSIEEVAQKYGVSIKTIRKECNRRGIYLAKRPVRVTRTYKYVTEVTEYESVYQCALALGVDSATIKRAIAGEYIRKINKYKIEYIKKEEYYDEQIGERYSIKQD